MMATECSPTLGPTAGRARSVFDSVWPICSSVETRQCCSVGPWPRMLNDGVMGDDYLRLPDGDAYLTSLCRRWAMPARGGLFARYSAQLLRLSTSTPQELDRGVSRLVLG